jgi:hypothetical protein
MAFQNRVVFVVGLLLALASTSTLAIPENPAVIALWPNGKCQGAPAIAFPIGIFVDLEGCLGPESLPLRILKKGRPVVSSPPYMGFQCTPNRAYSFGEDSCSQPLRTEANFEEYCITPDGIDIPISGRLLCGKLPLPNSGCDPKFATTRTECSRRTNRCLASSFVMKW